MIKPSTKFRSRWAKVSGKVGRFYCRHKWLEDVIPFLPWGSTALDHFLQKASCRYDLLEDLNDTEDCLGRLAGIDQRIMTAVRSMHHPLTMEQRRTCYRDILSGATKNDSLLLETTLELLNTNSVTPDYGPPAVTVDVSPTCKTVVFTTNEGALTVKNATLLWDCNCKDPYPPRYNRAPCPIHGQHPKHLGKYLSQAFNHGLVKINYDGTSVYWRQLKDLWPPSVDAFHMVRNLTQDGYYSLPAQTVCDLGCGTGFLGIWAGRRNSFHRQIVFADWLLSPLIISHANVFLTRECARLKARFRLGLHDDWVNEPRIGRSKKVDVVLCNPPYLPVMPGHEDILFDSTVAGTDLLEYVIENADSLGNRVFISFSSVVAKEANAALERAGKSLRHVGSAKPVPFRVTHAFDKHGYTEALEKDNRVEYRANSVHPYWHSVGTYEVLAKENRTNTHDPSPAYRNAAVA